MAEEFWKTSPFGKNSIFHPDWDAKQKQAKLQRYEGVKITEMKVAANYLPENSGLFSPQPTIIKSTNIISSDSNFVTVAVKAIVNLSNRADQVKIALNKNSPITASKSIGNSFQYEANFKVKVGKSIPRIDQYGSQEFTFTATVTDIFTKEVSDTRSVTVKIDTEGKVGESLLFNPNSKISIVIDPGHGYTKGNTGATCKIYTHKIRGEDGEPLKKDDGEFETSSANIMKLPQYVIDDPTSWVISKKEDPNHNERGLVFDISVKLKDLLEKDGFTCFLTRESKVIQGTDDSSTRKKRIDLANNKQAHYFISVHADGADNETSSGAHVIYPKTTDNKVSTDSKQLAVDIFKFYNVVQVESNSPKEDVRGLQVLGSTNKTNRKVLVELGFVTTPRDAKAMFSNIDKIAEQLHQGLVFNIKNNF